MMWERGGTKADGFWRRAFRKLGVTNELVLSTGVGSYFTLHEVGNQQGS